MEGLLELVASPRLSLSTTLLAVVFMFAACVSALRFLQRYVQHGDVPVALARVIAVLVIAVSYWAANVVAMAAIPAEGVLEWSGVAFAVQILCICLAAITVTLVGSEERPDAPRHIPFQIAVFAVITALMHHYGFAVTVIDAPLAERLPGIAAGMAVGTLPVVLGMRLLAVRDRVEAAVTPVAALLAVVVVLPPVTVTYLAWLAAAPVDVPVDVPVEVPAEAPPTPWVMIIIAIVTTLTAHLLGWLIADRSSERFASRRRELRLLDASLRALLDESSNWVGVIDPQGRVLASHPRAIRGTSGITLRPGSPDWSLIPGPLRERLVALFERSLARPRELVVEEVIFEDADGVEFSELRLFNRVDDPEIGGVIVAARSLTALRREQASAEAHRMLYGELFEHAPLPMLVSDVERGVILDVNPAMAELLGAPRQSLRERPALDIAPPQTRGEVRRFADELMREGARAEMTLMLGGGDGGPELPCRVRSTVFREGASLLRLSMLEDISAQTRERALLENEIRLLELLAQARDLDQWLQALVAWLGEVAMPCPRAVLVWQDPRRRQLAADQLDDAQLEVLRGLGPEQDAQALDGFRQVEIVDAQHRRIGLVVVDDAALGDAGRLELAAHCELAARLTALAAEREVSALMLRHAQQLESLGRVTGGVAHDFNNLLTVIMGGADLLASSPDLEPREQELARTIVGSAARASAVTHRLLSLSRRQPVHMEDVDLVPVLRDAPQWLSGVLGEGVELVIGELPDAAVVRCDRALLDSSLLNLVINARDAMGDAGRVTLELARRRLDGALEAASGRLEAGTWWVLSVRDTGPGLAPDVRPHVLDPFFTTKSGAGTGLGLPMVARFLSDAGGALDFGDDEDGAVVELHLPRRLTSVSAGDRAPAAPAPGRRVLVVEDQAALAEFLRWTLTEQGHAVDLLERADDARIRITAGARYDLVVTDVGLPGELDGGQFARWLLAAQPQIAVLVIGGAILPGDDFGAECLPKPFDSQALTQACARALARGASGDHPMARTN